MDLINDTSVGAHFIDIKGASFSCTIRPPCRCAAPLMNEMNSYFRADLHVAIAAPTENENGYFRGRSINLRYILQEG